MVFQAVYKIRIIKDTVGNRFSGQMSTISRIHVLRYSAQSIRKQMRRDTFV